MVIPNRHRWRFVVTRQIPYTDERREGVMAARNRLRLKGPVGDFAEHATAPIEDTNSNSIGIVQRALRAHKPGTMIWWPAQARGSSSVTAAP